MKSQPVSARVTRRFSAPAERVFDAWLDPATVHAWMTLSERKGPGGELLRVRIDGRVGGTFSFLIRRNGQEIDHVGEYLEIDRPRRLVFTWAAGAVGQAHQEYSRVTIAIVPLGSGCELTLTHEMDEKWAEFADRARGAWAHMLDTIAQFLG
jgi:uncharacterized protein YndB with AHSA1/START domain